MKTWNKPVLEVTEIRLARFHMFANNDAGSGLLTQKNQPS